MVRYCLILMKALLSEICMSRYTDTLYSIISYGIITLNEHLDFRTMEREKNYDRD